MNTDTPQTKPKSSKSKNKSKVNKSIEDRIFDAYKKTLLPKNIPSKKPKKQENTEPRTEPPNKQSTQSKVDKEKKILKILKYQNSQRFASRLKKDLGIKYTRQQLLKCSDDNLDGILFRIRNYLNNSNLDKVFEHLARYASKGYEDLVSQFIDIEGFSDLLMDNPAFWDAYSIWQIEQEMPELPPSIQMMYIISSTTYIAYLQNKVKHIQKPKSKPKDTVPKSEPKDTVPKDTVPKDTVPKTKTLGNTVKIGDTI